MFSFHIPAILFKDGERGGGKEGGEREIINTNIGN
jgi:hypothetical protein